jgi:hypothetical protein
MPLSRGWTNLSDPSPTAYSTLVPHPAEQLMDSDRIAPENGQFQAKTMCGWNASAII